MENISRKKFIAATALAAAGLPFGLGALAKPYALPGDINNLNPALAEKIKVSIFSKHLHWLNYSDMAALAAQLGFDGVDLTVRPDGVTDDLPKAVEAVEKAGLKVYSIVTNIKTADEKDTEPILKAASASGIKYYRTAWFNYDKISMFRLILKSSINNWRGWQLSIKNMACTVAIKITRAIYLVPRNGIYG
jgi:hypothetical protein